MNFTKIHTFILWAKFSFILSLFITSIILRYTYIDYAYCERVVSNALATSMDHSCSMCTVQCEFRFPFVCFFFFHLFLVIRHVMTHNFSDLNSNYKNNKILFSISGNTKIHQQVISILSWFNGIAYKAFYMPIEPIKKNDEEKLRAKEEMNTKSFEMHDFCLARVCVCSFVRHSNRRWNDFWDISACRMCETVSRPSPSAARHHKWQTVCFSDRTSFAIWWFPTPF